MAKVTKVLQSELSLILLVESSTVKFLVCFRDFTLDNLADTAGLYLWLEDGADLKCEGALLQRFYMELIDLNGGHRFTGFNQLAAFLLDCPAVDTGWLANYFSAA